MVRTRISIHLSMVVFQVIRTGLGFGIRSNMNLVYQYRTLLRLREQSFEIRFGFKLRIGTPLHRNLISINQNFSQNFCFTVLTQSPWSKLKFSNLIEQRVPLRRGGGHLYNALKITVISKAQLSEIIFKIFKICLLFVRRFFCLNTFVSQYLFKNFGLNNLIAGHKTH